MHTKTRLLKYICFFISACMLAVSSPVYAKDLVIGLLLAGPHNDGSYNQLHLNAAQTAAAAVPKAKVIYIDQANPIRRPNVTIPEMVDDLVQKGASIIIANTYEMELGITAAAPNYPQVTFIQINGDEALKQQALPNIINVALPFEYAQMLAGFAAGMASQTGKIAYLGASPNSESYRQISAAYLGAKYAWETVRGMPSKDFRFRLKWMGNWFDNLSPNEDTKTSTIKLFDGGSDVIVGGNGSTNILVAAQEAYEANKHIHVLAVADPYTPLNTFPHLVGLSFYNWQSVYEDLLKRASQENLQSAWIKPVPDFINMDKFTETTVGFIPYSGLNDAGKEALHQFMSALAEGKINLFTGPLLYKDGSVFTEAGQTPTPAAMHNMSQLLEGIEELPLGQQNNTNRP